MAEFQMRPPIRIPTEEDYAVGGAIVDDTFENHDGAWYSYQKEAIIGIQTRPSLRDFYENLSSVSKLIEPISNDDHKPLDPLFAATHAFRAGLWTGKHLSQEVYWGKIQYKDVHNTIITSAPHPTYSGQAEYEANGEYLTSIGTSGLERVGHVAREYIEKWGNDIVCDPTVRKYYALGAGAVVSAYHHIYSRLSCATRRLSRL
jgi:hypothetical protein